MWYKKHKTNHCTCKSELRRHIRNHQSPKIWGKPNINKNQPSSIRETTAVNARGTTVPLGGDKSADPGVTVELDLNPCSVTCSPSNLQELNSMNLVQQMFIESITSSVVSPKVIKLKRSDPCFQGDQNLAMVTETCTINHNTEWEAPWSTENSDEFCLVVSRKGSPIWQ